MGAPDKSRILAGIASAALDALILVALIAGLRNHPERYFRSYLCSGVTAVFDVDHAIEHGRPDRTPRRTTDLRRSVSDRCGWR